MLRPPGQRGLQAFRQTMLTGSVTGAATALRRSQPAISRLLKELETDIGFTLFDRVRGRLVPTPEGRLFFDELQRAFAGFERIAAVAAEIRGGRRGTLRVGAMPAAAATFLPQVIRRFAEAHPGAAVSLQVQASTEVTRLVQTQDCDLGIVEGTLSPPGLHAERDHDVPCAVILPEGHPLAAKRRIAPRDLAGQDLVALTARGSSLGAQLEGLLGREGVACRTRIETHLAHIVSALVLEGMGIGVVDRLTAKAHAARGGLVRPFAADLTLRIRLVRSAASPPSSLMEGFMALCDAAIAGGRGRRSP